MGVGWGQCLCGERVASTFRGKDCGQVSSSQSIQDYRERTDRFGQEGLTDRQTSSCKCVHDINIIIKILWHFKCFAD